MSQNGQTHFKNLAAFAAVKGYRNASIKGPGRLLNFLNF